MVAAFRPGLERNSLGLLIEFLMFAWDSVYLQFRRNYPEVVGITHNCR